MPSVRHLAFGSRAAAELIDDSGVDLVGYLARQAGRAIGNASGAHFITGDGSSKPNGVVTASTLGVTGASGQSGAPSADELIDLHFSVIPEYRRAGTWLMSDATWAGVRKLKDSDKQYLVDRLGSAGELSLLSRPVVIDTNVADTGVSAKSVLFGDFSAYYIRDVRELRFERSDDYAFNQDLVTFRALLRTDGDLIDTTGAIKHYLGGAS